MDEQSLQLDIDTSPVGCIVTPLGDIDMTKSTEFRYALKPIIESKPTLIIINLAHVPYMDSSGVATLIEGLQLSKQANIPFSLCALSKGVQSIIELARLDKIFSIYETKEQALEE
ncbi:MAG: STAS domain-containing protein [Phycisphaerae bacterium]|jgi:anti-sigma B factor antagonist|nr:STAS domain-containing protein [Phycisphaerae bacterium]